MNDANGTTGSGGPSPPTWRSGTGAPPLRLVVLADSTSFTDGTGPQLPGEPTLYPNVLARRLEVALDRRVAVTVIARPGTTVRDALATVRKDQHVQFDVIAHADALVVGVGSFDHAPAGTPPALEAMVPYLHPPQLRRRARRWTRAAYPRLVAVRRGHGRRTPAAEFATLYRQLLEQLRGLSWGRAAGVALGPTSHRSAYYGHRHPEHAAAQAAQLRLAREHGFATVAAWPLVEPHADELNVDGIHWPAVAHEAVGHALADALLPQLRGESPVIGLPGAARDAGLADRSTPASVNDMNDVEALREAVDEPFAAAGVCFSYLFGSRARRDSTAGSDTDIAVRFGPGIPPDERLRRLLRLGTELERVVGGPVDVVDLEEAPLRLAGRIATERVILTGHDEQERVRFETNIVPRYLDFKYHADRLDRMILDEMAAGRR